MLSPQVETELSIFSALIQPTNFSNTSMAVKKEFVAHVDDLGRGMCQGLSTGEPAVAAESHIVVIRSEQSSFDTVDANFTNVACDNCSKTVKASAQVLLGQTLKDRYDTWDCDEDGCTGACVVSAQVIVCCCFFLACNVTKFYVLVIKMIFMDLYLGNLVTQIY